MKPDLFSSRPGAGTELLDRMHQKHGDKIPGVSIAVIDGGELAWAGGYGVLEAWSNKPVTTESLFRACSLSKPIAAIAAVSLVQERTAF